jgi:hypothetical protein
MLLFLARGVRPEWARAGTERAPTGAIGVRKARRGGTVRLNN